MAQSAAVAQSAACALFLVSPIVEGCESLPPRIDLLRDQVVIGRSRKNATVVVDPPPPAPPNVISRKHASIVYEAPHWVLYDNESLNGVFLNGAKTEQTELRSGDVIQLGGTVVASGGHADSEEHDTALNACVRYRFSAAESASASDGEQRQYSFSPQRQEPEAVGVMKSRRHSSFTAGRSSSSSVTARAYASVDACASGFQLKPIVTARLLGS